MLCRFCPCLFPLHLPYRRTVSYRDRSRSVVAPPSMDAWPNPPRASAAGAQAAGQDLQGAAGGAPRAHAAAQDVQAAAAGAPRVLAGAAGA
jgi:hypothetical protein